MRLKKNIIEKINHGENKMSEFTTKVLRIIQSSEVANESIEIDSSDNGCVEVRFKKGQEVIQYTHFPPAQAKLVAKAMTQCAGEMERNQAL
jgi:hypothetical protein